MLHFNDRKVDNTEVLTFLGFKFWTHERWIFPKIFKLCILCVFSYLYIYENSILGYLSTFKVTKYLILHVSWIIYMYYTLTYISKMTVPVHTFFRSVRASHILIGDSGNVCLSGLSKVYHMVYHGKKWTQIHNYPEACSADLQWFSPEILEQVSLFIFFQTQE